MIKKLMCWLGWHEYIKACSIWKTRGACYMWRFKSACSKCDYNKPICIHCGKIKKS